MPVFSSALAFGAEDDVFQHGEILDQHEVLVDHADADGDGVVRRRGSTIGLPSTRISPLSAW